MTTEKQKARKQMRRKLAAMGSAAAARKSALACEALTRLPEFAAARVVMAYMSIPGEVDTRAVFPRAWRDGKTVLLPKMRWAPRGMIAVPYRSLDDSMVTGRYNIPEPAGDEAWPPGEIDLVVVPALAYDRRGNRLGKGGGFYDRFMADQAVGAVLCGLAFDEQVVPNVHQQEHDVKVDVLVTDRETLRWDRPPAAGEQQGKQERRQ